MLLKEFGKEFGQNISLTYLFRWQILTDTNQHGDDSYLYSAFIKAQSALQHFAGDFARLLFQTQIAATQFAILLW